MIEFNNTKVYGLDTAIRSMRMPMKSFDKSDSYVDQSEFVIGQNDLDLCHRLLSNNDADSKFLRSIQVYTEITAPVLFLQELDTYKIATVRNSSSLQHKGASRNFTLNDYDLDDMSFLEEDGRDLVITADEFNLRAINYLRQKYKETNDYRYFRLMRQHIMMSYKYDIAWTANYQVLRNIWKQRVKQKHRLVEWQQVGEWLAELPYAADLITFTKEDLK